MKKVEAKIVSHYKIGKKLGKGGFASVYRAQDMHTKIDVAVKIFEKEKLTDTNLIQIEKEISIHKNLHHKNIAKVY